MSTKEEIINRMHCLQPHLSREAVERKIADAKSYCDKEFRLFRAFVPYFYDLVQELNIKDKLHPATQCKGKCVGDPHLENFGFVLPPSGNHHSFTMNDPDDGGEGALVFDVLRFLTGTYLYKKKKSNLETIIQWYQVGLQGNAGDGDKESIQSTEDKLRSKLNHGGRKPTKGLFDKKLYTLLKDEKCNKHGCEKNGEECTKELDFGFYVSDREREVLRSAIDNHLPPSYETKDIVKFTKLGGGSGGLLQYRVLLKQKDQENPFMVYDVKPLVRSGMYPLYCGQPGSKKSSNTLCSLRPREIVRRVKKTLAAERGQSSTCVPIVIPDLGPFLLRPRWKGDAGVDLAKFNGYKHLSLENLLQLEAFTLGTLHRRALRKKQRADYGDKVHSLEKKLRQSAIDLAQKMEKEFKQL